MKQLAKAFSLVLLAGVALESDVVQPAGASALGEAAFGTFRPAP
jgi:hypothetical protein